jgi:hypothetical protein
MMLIAAMIAPEGDFRHAWLGVYGRLLMAREASGGTHRCCVPNCHYGVDKYPNPCWQGSTAFGLGGKRMRLRQLCRRDAWLLHRTL